MCLGIPMKIVEIKDRVGVVESMGVRREAILDLLPSAKVGDWVIVHAGYAIQLLDEDSAQETLSLLRSAYGLSD